MYKFGNDIMCLYDTRFEKESQYLKKCFKIEKNLELLQFYVNIAENKRL